LCNAAPLASFLGMDGGPRAYTELVEPHRGELQAHAYRMLGSFHDAEDAVQEALIRAWRSLAKVQHSAALRAWLHQIATNTSLDAIKRRPRPAVHLEGDLSTDPRRDESGRLAESQQSVAAVHERREELEMALTVAFGLLPANQRAVLILRAALGFSARETAELLWMTVAAVNSALARARATLISRAPADGEVVASRPSAEARGVAERLGDAWERDDVEAVVALAQQQARGWRDGTKGPACPVARPPFV
jgi:RNA polymerase sigma-70 factor (ECF subfamily)